MKGIRFNLKDLLWVLLLSALIATAGCSFGEGSSSSSSTGQDPFALDILSLYSTVTFMTVHVAYEPDAKPFTGSFPDGGQYWSVLQNNLDALFLGHTIEPTIVVPKDISQMVQIAKQAQTSWTLNQIYTLAQSLWDTPQTSTSVQFYVLYLNGFYNDNGEVNQEIIGLSIGNTPIIVVFKDVITSSGYPLLVEQIMEQATLVHEFGHAMGLVNEGVPMISNHEDPDHPNHCTNKYCAMYWQNDGRNLNVFIQKIIDSPSDVIFGRECLNDTRNYEP
jgi:hypothetical protein